MSEINKEILQRVTRLETIVEERFKALDSKLPICIGPDNHEKIKVLESQLKTNQKITWTIFVAVIATTIKGIFFLEG